MKVEEIMTPNPVCCGKETPIQEAARLMVQLNCGAIPVVEGTGKSARLIGVITDRDITVRSVAAGKNPASCAVADAMSHPVATVDRSSSLDDCVKVMERNQVRRVPVVDQSGALVGIVAQADLARCREAPIGEVVQAISKGFGSGH